MNATLESAHLAVSQLVREFKQSEKHYLSTSYVEASLRADFLDKFWKALGWDVSHDTQTNPAEQEVKIERNVQVAMAQKRADYAFFLAPNYRDVRFFVEAKKPSVDLDRSADAHFQTLRYGWNANTPLAVLTDFEQFFVLDCRAKPDIKTAIHRAHKKYHYTEFLDRETFAGFYWLFSREALAGGALDRAIADLPKPSSKAKQMGLLAGAFKQVDESFLDDLEQYRETLAKAFKRDNPDLDGFTLTEVTQRVLDRLVFLRFLEDKLIETDIRVSEIGRAGDAWAEFIAESKRLDGRYNGGVYRPHPLIDTGKLKMGGDEFRDVCEELGNAHSPYNFNAIPIHILGSIYERFLGKVVTTTDKRAKIEEKPEVRKAGGVYYTPEYIVRYIVDGTVGKLIDGKTPAEIARLRFADIACGSGSFALAVFDTLLAYHTHWYNDHPDRAEKDGCAKNEDGAWRLTLSQRRKILLNNVYGVDIDRQAVEVTQVSLYLKLLEEETTASAHQFELQLRETLLPSLTKNIVCGNSLIGTDILTGQMFARDEERALNPMDFEDAFPEVMRAGGFDAIVGNPPYVNIELIPEIQRSYFQKVYGKDGKLGKRYDLYQVFILVALQKLKTGGRLGYIVPNTFLMGYSYQILREKLLKATHIEELVDLPQGVFYGVTVDNVLIFLRRVNNLSKGADFNILINKLYPKSSKTRVSDKDWDESFSIAQKPLEENPKFEINIHTNAWQTAFFAKLEKKSLKLGVVTESSQGIILYKTAEDAEKSSFTSFIPHSGWQRLLRGRNIGRYQVKWNQEFVKYGNWLWCARDEKFFNQPKILLQAMRNKSLARRLIATYDEDFFYNAHNLANIISRDNSPYSLKYILGLFNSALLNFWYKSHFPNVNINPNDFRQLPIRPINFDDPADVARHDKMVGLVDAMLDAKKKLAAAQNEADTDYWTRRCDSLDRQIDTLVYELYDLSGDEIAIVEGRDKKSEE